MLEWGVSLWGGKGKGEGELPAVWSVRMEEDWLVDCGFGTAILESSFANK